MYRYIICVKSPILSSDCELESNIIYHVQNNSKVMDTTTPQQTVPFIDIMLVMVTYLFLA